MSRRFCAQCGKTNVPLEENFCEECYWRFNSIIKAKNSKLNIPYCLSCYAVKLPTGWSKANEQLEIPDEIGYGFIRNILADIEVDIEYIGVITSINWLNPNPEFTIQYMGTSEMIESFGPHEETIDVEIKLQGGICKTCVRRKTGTHDVTVQLRADKRALTKKEVDRSTTILFTIASELYNETSNAYVSDIIENHGGVDFYLGNISLAEEFVSKLTKTWIGHKEKNYKLITEEKDNTRVYRTTFLFRIPSVQEGDLVVWQNSVYRVLIIMSNAIRIRNLITGEIISTNKWKELIKPDPDPEIINYLVISEDKQSKSYLLMNMNTFENIEINISSIRRKLEIGVETEFFKWNNILFLP